MRLVHRLVVVGEVHVHVNLVLSVVYDVAAAIKSSSTTADPPGLSNITVGSTWTAGAVPVERSDSSSRYSKKKNPY